MKIILYSKKGCPMCDQAKLLFQRADLEYTEMKVGRELDITPNELQEKYPDAIAYPFITIDRMEFVGIVDVARYLLQKGFVTSNKNGQT